MKNKLHILALAAVVMGSSCTKEDFSGAYTNPASLSQSTVEKQYAGALNTSMQGVLPSYWNYFVILRTTLQYFNQAVGWSNYAGQYVPGAAAISDRWNNFYNYVAQYRELEKIHKALPADDQANYRIFMLTAKIYFFDMTQKTVDLHGDIPWSKAGMLSANGGDYIASLPAYDAADKIYTSMLDELKAMSDELATINVNPGILVGFRNQDIINKGDVTKWRRYCNSLRLRILTRVSDAPAFSARATAEIASILSNPTQYPIVSQNSENIQITVLDLSTGINSSGFRTGLEDWNGNMASKRMIDHMKANSDPRLRYIFEPGLTAGTTYDGVDPLGDATVTAQLISGGKIAMYNRTTLSRNQFFPGVLMNAAEVQLLAAEAYLKAGNNAAAKTAYERAIAASIDQYVGFRNLSKDATSPAVTAPTAAELAAYPLAAGISWDAATTTAAKLALIFNQKYIHFNVVQPLELWAENRRLDPAMNFWTDNSVQQTRPPVRWVYPSVEQIYNKENYSAVSAKDNLTTKLFWDVK